jgi:hypothetical protein
MILIILGNVHHIPLQHRYGRDRLLLLSTRSNPHRLHHENFLQNLTGIRCSLLRLHQRGMDAFYSIRQVMIYGSSCMTLSLLNVDQVSMKVFHGKKIGLGLDYSDEDVESSCTCVLFCPFEILEDGTMITYPEFEDPRTYTPYFFYIVSQISAHIASHRIHRIHNYRSIRRLHRGTSRTRRLQRHQRTVNLGGSRRQHPNRNIHLIPHPQTSCSRSKTTHPLLPRLRSKLRHHGGDRRD